MPIFDTTEATGDMWDDDLWALKPVTITPIRNNAALTPITVRLETWVSRQRPFQTPNAITSIADILIFGPLNTDLQFGDRFLHSGRMYEVISVIPETTHQFQAAGKIRD